MRNELHARFADVLTPAALDLLGSVIDVATEFSIDDFGDVLISFADGDLTVRQPLRCADPDHPGHARQWEQLQDALTAHTSAEFRAFLDVCAGLVWGEVGDTGQLVLGHGFDAAGGAGTLHCVGDDAMNAEGFGFSYAPTLFSPIDINLDDYYVVHPGSGRLCYMTEGTLGEVVDTNDPIEVYLRELRYVLGIDGATHRSAWLEYS